MSINQDFHLEIPHEVCMGLLKPIRNVSPSTSALPILQQVLVKTSVSDTGENVVSFEATDGELTIVTKDTLEPNAAFEDGVEFLMNAKKAYNIMASLKDAKNSQLQISKESGGEDSIVKIKSGKSVFKVASLDSDDFPAKPLIDNEDESATSLTINGAALLKAMNTIVHAVASNDIRYYLNGACFDFQTSKDDESNVGLLNIVSSDGHRLAVSTTLFHATPDVKDFKIIIPRATLNALIKLIGGNKSLQENDIVMTFNERQAEFDLSTSLVSTKLIDGKYPNYQELLPSENRNMATVEIRSLKNALAQAAILSNERYRGIKLSLYNNLIRVTSINPEQEGAVIDCEAQYHGDDIEIGFNAVYLQEALSAIGINEAELYFADSNSSCLIKPLHSESARFVIMPMRL